MRISERENVNGFITQFYAIRGSGLFTGDRSWCTTCIEKTAVI